LPPLWIWPSIEIIFAKFNPNGSRVGDISRAKRVFLPGPYCFRF
jgi:hypothetical protein